MRFAISNNKNLEWRILSNFEFESRILNQWKKSSFFFLWDKRIVFFFSIVLSTFFFFHYDPESSLFFSSQFYAALNLLTLFVIAMVIILYFLQFYIYHIITRLVNRTCPETGELSNGSLDPRSVHHTHLTFELFISITDMDDKHFTESDFNILVTSKICLWLQLYQFSLLNIDRYRPWWYLRSKMPNPRSQMKSVNPK